MLRLIHLTPLNHHLWAYKIPILYTFYLKQSNLSQRNLPYRRIVIGLDEPLDGHQAAAVAIPTFVYNTVGSLAQFRQLFVAIHAAAALWSDCRSRIVLCYGMLSVYILAEAFSECDVSVWICDQNNSSSFIIYITQTHTHIHTHTNESIWALVSSALSWKRPQIHINLITTPVRKPCPIDIDLCIDVNK